ncbi:isochorismate synthase [Bacillus kexueae]|uniref:isochorismate synthase n=1 Tax=Aeribacillus kexueae TaxID=2078952 RepID=UPI001FAFD44A
MITVQRRFSLLEEIKKTQEMAKKHQHPMLFSYAVQIEQKDPLQLFALIDQLKPDWEHFFWTTPDRDFLLCGFGVEMSIENQYRDESRYYTVEAIWNEWKAYTYKTGINQYGTGPLLFGGFSFDPKKMKKTEKWDDFTSAKFHLPQVLITKDENKWFITLNKVVSEQEQPLLYEEQLELWLKIINEDSHLFKQQAKVKETMVFHEKEWIQAVEKATSAIKRGSFEKVVLARDVLVSFDSPLSIGSILYRLEENQKSSFLFSFQVGDKSFIGATPERLIKKNREKVHSACVAGSIRRGATMKEDESLGAALLADEKNLHEHEVVVRMITNAFEECCSSLKKENRPNLLKTKNIQHLFTPIEGFVRDGYSIMDFVEKLHPTPALGGYPKKESLRFIREEEPMDRGWYASPIGWFDNEDNGEFVVAIRSGLIHQQAAHLFAGCGIVEHSNPNEEWEETEVKLGPMMDALGGLHNEE